MNKMNVLIIMLIVILVVLTILYFVVGNYFYNIALNPNTSKEFVLGEEVVLEKENWLTESAVIGVNTVLDWGTIDEFVRGYI